MSWTYQAYGQTDVGRRRQHNEDSMLIDSTLGLYAVADGMGGHAAGEIASQRAVELVRQQVAHNISALKKLGQNPTPAHRNKAAEMMENAILAACADIYAAADKEATKRGMGTTFVSLAVSGNKGVIANVGDSRVYLIRGGQCHRLTEDHTLVAAQIKAGVISKAQAAQSEYRNVITRAVGIQKSVQVDTLIVDVLPKDVFLLCTDGLHGYLSDEEIPAFILQNTTKDLPKKFVALANERGGKDNVTVVVVAAASEGAIENDEAIEAQSRMEALRKIPLFQHLTYKEQTAVLSIGTTQTFAAGQDIVVEGQPGEELFVIVRGRVTVSKGGVDIAELKVGGHFGEMGLIDNAPRSATVKAAEATRVMVISRRELMNLMKKESVLAVKMLWSFVQVLSDRLRIANSELSEARQELAVAQALQPFTEE